MADQYANPNLGIAMEALLALTPHERGLVLCWFCDACHEYVGPEASHRCKKGSAVWPAADLEDATPRGDRREERIRRLAFDMKEMDDGAVVVENYLWGNDTSDEAHHEQVLYKTVPTWAEAIDHVQELLDWLKGEVTK